MDVLERLLEAADATLLRRLVRELTASRPDAQRAAIQFLKQRVSLPPEADSGAAVLARWAELEPDLHELDAYGGGDDNQVDFVAQSLYELDGLLTEGDVPRSVRRELLRELLRYIASGNSGLDDALYGLAYATCYDQDDRRFLAEQFAALGREWTLENARRIYREIGDRDKYLALRAQRMVYGSDYYDLVTFYEEAGEQEKALAVAREGLTKAAGRMDKLQAFLANHALQTGNRPEYLEFEFAKVAGRLTPEGYRTFRALCMNDEWQSFEPRLLAVLPIANVHTQLEIHLLRHEEEQAANLIAAVKYPSWYDTEILQVAEKLERRFPEQIMTYYRRLLGDPGAVGSRSLYAQKARGMLKLRRVWVDVLDTPDQWREFARRVKAQNMRRPAFQEECARAIPDWNTL